MVALRICSGILVGSRVNILGTHVRRASLDLLSHNLLVDDTIRCNLAEHLQRVEPSLHTLQPHCVIDLGNRNTLNIDIPAMGLDGDFLALASLHVSYCSTCHANEHDLLIEPHIIILHLAPVPPSKCHLRRPTIHLEHLPRKMRHHPLERLVARRKVLRCRAVVLVRRDDGIVSTDFEHVLCRLRRPAVDGEGVVGMVDGAPVGKARLEGRFDFPVLDEVLHELWETAGDVVRLLACFASMDNGQRTTFLEADSIQELLSISTERSAMPCLGAAAGGVPRSLDPRGPDETVCGVEILMKGFSLFRTP